VAKIVEVSDIPLRLLERFSADFARNEKAVGGPDPQIALIGEMSKDEPLQERIWRFCLYTVFYNVPATAKAWEHWPYARIVAEPDGLAPWLAEHIKQLPFRKERRAVRDRRRCERSIMSGLVLASRVLEADWWGAGQYELAYKDVLSSFYGVGRYTAIKLLEGWHRFCGSRTELHDLRPNGGWSPRMTLARLYPGHSEALLGSDTRENCEIANMCAGWLRETWAERYGVEVSWFDLQVLCCEFRESIESQRQFPGRSHDSELSYQRKIDDDWGPSGAAMYAARAALFPHESLGELRGWDSVREELGPVNALHGYVWSDLEYDYWLSRDDLAHPVRRLAIQAA
jgi:hypothetical protein